MSDETFEVAERVCTPRQLEVVRLYRRGAGFRLIALILGLSRSTVRDHWKEALRRIAAAGG